MRRASIVFLLLCAALTVWGCRELSPEERVAKARARYAAKVNEKVFVREVPVEQPAPVEEAEPDAEPADEPAEGADPSEEEMVAPLTRQEVLLDIIVQHDLDEALPGITVDVVMLDADGNEKGSWKVWVETEGLPKANQKPLLHVLTDVGYVEGDAFQVAVRRPIPPEEWGDYREFSEAGGS